MAMNLSPATWQPLAGGASNATGTNVTFIDPNPAAGQQRFYRTASP